MKDTMTEAAKLYSENFAVLSEALGELNEFLEAVWERAWAEVQSQWTANESMRDLKEPGCWKEKADPGCWHVSIPESRVGIEVLVSDPRRSLDSKLYTVELSTSAAGLKRLKRANEQALIDLGNIAKAEGIELNWRDTYHLSCDNVELVHESASQTARALADCMFSNLLILSKMERWATTRGVAAT